MTDNVRYLDLPPEVNARLKRGGGGDNTGGMDARISRLESRIDKVDDRLRGVEVSLATLNERVAHLPGKGFIVTVVLTAVAVLGALVTFSDKLKSLVGIAL